MAEVSSEQDKEALKEINNIVLSEIEIAKTVNADYYHNFTLPDNLGTKFNITLRNKRELVSRYEDEKYLNFLSTNVTGEFNDYATTRWNMVYKTDGLIVLQNGTKVELGDEYKGIFLNVNPETCYVYNTTTSLGCDALSDIKDRCNEYTKWC